MGTVLKVLHAVIRASRMMIPLVLAPVGPSCRGVPTEELGRSSGLQQSWTNIKYPCQYHIDPRTRATDASNGYPLPVPSLSPISLVNVHPQTYSLLTVIVAFYH